jgi:Deacetylase PdaC/Protein of unknown function (DUF3298)
MRACAITLGLAMASVGAWAQSSIAPIQTIKSGEPDLYLFSISSPKLPVKHPLARTFNAHFLKWTKRETERFAHAAESIFEETTKPSSPYRYDVGVQTQYISQTLVSVLFRVTEYTGGAHGNSTFRAANFAITQKGPTEIALKDLFAPGFAYGPFISLKVIAVLMKNPKATFVTNGQMRDLDADQLKQFALDPSGITFWIEPYAAGPYSSGVFSVRLKFSELEGRVRLPFKLR